MEKSVLKMRKNQRRIETRSEIKSYTSSKELKLYDSVINNLDLKKSTR